MKKQRGVCVEINGVFYESYRSASRAVKCDDITIKNRCLSDKFPNYKIVPIDHSKKRCPTCGKVKLLKEFSKNTRAISKLQSACKQCDKERREKNKEKNKEYQRVYYKKNKNKIRKQGSEWKRKKRENDTAYKLNSNMGHAINMSLKGMKKGEHWETLAGYTYEELVIHLESLFTEGMSWENYGKGGWEVDHIIAASKWNITSTECQEFRDCWSLDNLQPLWELRNTEKGTKPMEPKYLIKPF